MNTHLDELITAAAPPVAQRTLELQDGLHSLVADTEAVAVPTKHRLGRRIGAISLATVGVLGVGAAANASGWVSWFDDPTALHEQTVLSSGNACEVVYAARALDDPAHPASSADQTAAMAVAKKFLRDFNLSTISIDYAVKKWNAASATALADLERRLPPEEIPPKETPDEVELLAVQAELGERLSTELKRQGLNSDAVSVAAANRCSDDRSGQ